MRFRAFFPSLLTLVASLTGLREADGRILVKVTAVGRSPVAAFTVQTAGWRHLREVGLYVVESEEDPLLRSLERDGAVDFAVPDSPIEMARVPNDPLFSGQEGPFGEEGVEALPVWDQAVGDAGVTVAVIDTGVDITHPDLGDNLWKNEGEIPDNGIDDDHNGYVDDFEGFDFADADPDPQDEHGHGTHMAGIIGAVGNNGEGVAGVNWQVRMMPLKFTGADGRGTTVLAVEAIDYAIRNGADVINASWNVAAHGPEVGPLDALREAIKRAGEAGILFVTAAGNDFNGGRDIDADPAYPAAFDSPEIVSVAALGSDGALAPFSNFGAIGIDLAAPGSGVLSTGLGGVYKRMNGTSVAAAFVSGAAAMLLSVNPHLSPMGVKEALLLGVRQDEVLMGVVGTGGRLNLAQSSQILTESPVDASQHLPTSSAEEERSPSPIVAGPPSGGCSLIP